jgi:very-short-patch-repair endonuclease
MKEYRDMFPNVPVANKISDKARDNLKEKWKNLSEEDRAKRVEKANANSIAKYGVHHTQAEEIKEKIRNTNLERYGSTHTMYIARRAFLEQNNDLNPFQVPEVKETIKETLIERYGVEYIGQRPEHKEMMRQKSRILYDRDNHAQMHISKENLEILHNKDLFTEMMKQHTISSMAVALGVGGETISRYCTTYGIERTGSSLEELMKNILDEYGVEYTRWDRKIIRPLELDFVLPQHKVAIEVGGLFHHSDYYLQNPSYHLNKMQKTERAGYRLLTLFEDELHNDYEIVKARIGSIIGLSERGVGARKLECRSITKTDGLDFLSNHHIQGGSKKSSIIYGAFFKDDLVAVMSFSKGAWRVGDSSAYELDRFSTNGKSYVGVASKLFKAFIREHSPQRVISYADRRWSQGHLYNTIGFKQTNIARPSYTYFKNKLARLDKTLFRKQKIGHLVEDGHTKSEFEITNELGYKRIYDCGHLRFEWHSDV